jgi:hypothetical protein
MEGRQALNMIADCNPWPIGVRFSRVLLLALLACSGQGIAKEPIDMAMGCRSNPQLVGTCFVVRGRLSAFNGNPTFRIRRAGSSRILGVVPSEDPRSLPAELRGVASFEHDVFGTFTVCPFTPAKAGVMQFVCVESVRNVHVRNRN